MRSILLAAFSAALVGFWHLAAAEGLPVLPSPQSIAERSLSPALQDSARVPLSAPAQAAPQGETAMEVLSIDPEKLRAPAAASGDAVRLGSSSSSASSSGALTLTVGGQKLDLAWVAESQDPSYAFRHVTYKVTNLPGYARFTVSPEQIVGTVVTPAASYRIVSSTRDRQRVYRQAKERHAVDPRDQHLSMIERRHVLLERLAAIQPLQADASETGRSLFIEGGSLGSLDTQNPTPEAIVATLRKYGDLTQAPERLEVAIGSMHRHRAGTSIEFRQLIDGVPVWQANRIETGADGAIQRMSTQFFDPSLAQEVRITSDARVMALARQAIERETGRRVTQPELLKSTELSYAVETPDLALVPYYRAHIKDEKQGGAWTVLVNAYSGESRLLARPQEFGWRYCQDRQLDQTHHPLTCASAPGTFQIFYHDYQSGLPSQCAYTPRPRDQGPCRTIEGRVPEYAMTVANTVLDAIEDATPGLCCAQIGGLDHTVEIVSHTSGADPSPGIAAAYDPTTESIISAGSITSIETLWHELGHHILYKSATQFDFASNYLRGKPFVDAFVEAYGDLTDVAMALQTAPSTNIERDYGDPWIHGDGPKGNGARNLKDPSITSFYHMTQFPAAHEGGRAIGKLFYLVYQTRGSMTGQRFQQFLLQVAQNIKDTDANGLDLFDLRRAMVASVWPNEIGFEANIMSNFDAMYNAMPPTTSPPVGAPPSTAPLAPLPVAVFTGGCPIMDNNTIGSQWLVTWNRPANVVFYVVSANAVSDGRLLDLVHVQGEQVFAETNTDAIVSVQACNSFNLCSTPGRTTVHHRTSCAGF
jgi:hypothetical protein